MKDRCPGDTDDGGVGRPTLCSRKSGGGSEVARIGNGIPAPYELQGERPGLGVPNERKVEICQ